MSHKPTIMIPGSEKGVRVESRVLEERIQKAVADGHRHIEIIAQGQHGIGGRLWRAGEETILLRILGTSGQRVGAMGFPNTLIDVVGPASDDVGWLNAGAQITVRGNATNGAGNAMAQGKIYVAGDIGARGMTMTKHNPRFDPPELWVLGRRRRFLRRIHGRRRRGDLRRRVRSRRTTSSATAPASGWSGGRSSSAAPTRATAKRTPA